MISVIITAGGVSRRFGSNKLLEKIGDKTVIETTILKFLDCADEIVIPCGGETLEFLKNSSVCKDPKIKFAQFGETRQKSVYNGLLALEYKDFVLIHDGARPFIEKKVIDEIIKTLPEKKALCCGVFAVDTIKITDEFGAIIKTIDRKNVFQAQTPQAFEYDLIMSAHNKFALRDDFTDDSSLVEALGVKVWTICGGSVNKKITTPADLAD